MLAQVPRRAVDSSLTATPPLTMSIGGETKSIARGGASRRYLAVYELESPDVLVSDAWSKAVAARVAGRRKSGRSRATASTRCTQRHRLIATRTGMLGILTLDTAFPRIRGDVGARGRRSLSRAPCARRGAHVEDVVHGAIDASLVPAFVDGGTRARRRRLQRHRDDLRLPGALAARARAARARRPGADVGAAAAAAGASDAAGRAASRRRHVFRRRSRQRTRCMAAGAARRHAGRGRRSGRLLRADDPARRRVARPSSAWRQTRSPPPGGWSTRIPASARSCSNARTCRPTATAVGDGDRSAGLRRGASRRLVPRRTRGPRERRDAADGRSA